MNTKQLLSAAVLATFAAGAAVAQTSGATGASTSGASTSATPTAAGAASVQGTGATGSTSTSTSPSTATSPSTSTSPSMATSPSTATSPSSMPSDRSSVRSEGKGALKTEAATGEGYSKTQLRESRKADQYNGSPYMSDRTNSPMKDDGPQGVIDAGFASIGDGTKVP